MNAIQFSIAAQAAWAPGLETAADWHAWARRPFLIEGMIDAPVVAMPAMLRRRAGFIGKMALEVAYRCLEKSPEERNAVPSVFSSRHGECVRSVALLQDLVQEVPLSPTAFSLSVHNATAGLLSIARQDQANHSALSAGDSGVEHAVIEACGLLADGADKVLLVVYDGLLPDAFCAFQDCEDQPFAWAWLLQSMDKNAANTYSLSWALNEDQISHSVEECGVSGVVLKQPAGLDVLRFQLRQDSELHRVVGNRRWSWRCDVQ
ncbi:beta-ketoacyl synthase chain length factor [Glaciimonas sp. GG7]